MCFVVVTLFHLYLIYIWLSFFLENRISLLQIRSTKRGSPQNINTACQAIRLVNRIFFTASINPKNKVTINKNATSGKAWVQSNPIDINSQRKRTSLLFLSERGNDCGGLFSIETFFNRSLNRSS